MSRDPEKATIFFQSDMTKNQFTLIYNVCIYVFAIFDYVYIFFTYSSPNKLDVLLNYLKTAIDVILWFLN